MECTEGFVSRQVIVRGGDIAEKDFGYTEEAKPRYADDLESFSLTPANVTFQPHS